MKEFEVSYMWDGRKNKEVIKGLSLNDATLRLLIDIHECTTSWKRMQAKFCLC